MYPEYDPNDPSLGQAFANMLRGFQNPQQWQEAGTSLKNALQLTPNVTESLGRGGVGQAIGTMGDLRDIRNTVQSYLPKSVQNFSNAAEFMTNPYAKALIQTAPTTEKVLETVPRVTPEYEGFKQHETLGEFVAPSLGYFGGKALKAGKNLPVGLSIEDVTPPPTKVAEALRQPEKNALGFYSPLDEAVMNLQNQKGTGQQYLAQLLKTQGVKQEEVATRGLDQFLTENPKVSREQIAQYLRENPVELKETVIGADSPRSSDSMSYEDYRIGEGQPIDDPEYIRSRADDIAYDYEANNPDIVQLMRENSMEELGFTPKDLENPYNQGKFEEYVNGRIYDDAYEQAKSEYWDNPYNEYTDEFGYKVVGNDDVGYHVTAPSGRTLRASDNGIYDINEVEQAIRDDALEQGLLHYADEEYGTKYHDYTLPNGENYREVLIQYPDVIGKDFQSGHFDEPNILAHFRTTDRTIDGKKTLFVEEIQSDWHQAGRKKGYNEPKALAEIQKQRQILLDKKDYYSKLAEPYVAQGKDAPPEVVEGWTLAANGLQELDKKQSALGRAVPDAPFKKNWQELAMKRAMQMAAEGGYDRVAFTTGKQQADRYSLSKQISSIKYTDDGQLRAYGKNGQEVIARKLSSPDELEDYIGKEAAKKLMEQEPKMVGIKTEMGTMSNTGRELSGVDLDVGGEGMKGFYDKILPDFINKYGKKHGLKVGQTNLPPDLNINTIVLNHTGLSRKEWDALSKAEKEQTLKEIGYGGNEGVHYFDLTPEAKESFLKKGQPMFAVAPVAITDEDTRREVLEKLFKNSGN